MAWEKLRDRCLTDNIQPQEDKDDVLNWLLSDPIWARATKITFNSKGSHVALVHIEYIGRILPKWDGNVLAISTVDGRYVKKWIVEQLAKGYKELLTLKGP